MNHTVLARKWRPKKFTDLIGQQNTVTILQNIIGTQRLHHAYLLTGTRGVGKTTIARIIAKALNCNNLTQNEPCGSCQNCQEINIGRFIDVIEIDAASNTGVDNIREVLENAQYAPTSGKYKIYIIDEVHMLSKSAFNAMLKTLEEPPAHVVFILATTDPHKVPITILSRCLQLKLRNLANSEIEAHLAWVLAQEQIKFEQEALEIIAMAAHGSMRDALSLTDQAIAFANDTITKTHIQQMLGISDDNNLIEILNAINQQNSLQLIEICQRLNREGSNLENILGQINYNLFQIGLAQLTPQPGLKPELQTLANSISIQDCQLYFEISNLGIEQISKVNNKYPVFAMTLLRMLAFKIGTNQQKQIFVNGANFNSKAIINNPVDNNNSTTTNKSKVDNSLNDCDKVNNVSKNISLAKSIDYNMVDKPIVNNTQNIGLSPHFDGNWLDFVEKIALQKVKDQSTILALRNSQLDSYQDQKLNLTISDSFRSLVTSNCVDIIKNLLFETYNIHFDINFNFAAATAASYKDRILNQEKQKQLEAEAAIYNDPIIQDLITKFSAKIIPGSIKPLDID